MKILILSIFSVIFLSSSLLAQSEQENKISALAKKLNLFAGTKASIQWERIFSSKRRMQQYQIDELSAEKQFQLKKFLINHAADSEQPIVPGL